MAFAFAVLPNVPLGAQTAGQNAMDSCAAYEAHIEMLASQIARTPSWDDATLSRAKTGLQKLKTGQGRIRMLGRRVKGADESSAIAENLDSSADARVWQQDAAGLRAQISNEARKAKVWAAEAGVHCPGCSYSTLVTKVESAIDQALLARYEKLRLEQELAAAQSAMAAHQCGEPTGPERG